MPKFNKPKIASQVARFGLIGGLATAVHAGVGVLAVIMLGVDGLVANVAGFLVAWWISFFGHYHFSFDGMANRHQALFRFIPHSLVMFIIGMSVATLVSVNVPVLPQSVLPIVGAVIVPVLSFLSSKFFVFKVSL